MAEVIQTPAKERKGPVPGGLPGGSARCPKSVAVNRHRVDDYDAWFAERLLIG